MDLLDSDYTFVNEKLASLYEIPNVRGSEMHASTTGGSPRRDPDPRLHAAGYVEPDAHIAGETRPLYSGNIIGYARPAAAPACRPGGIRQEVRGPGPTLARIARRPSRIGLCASCHSRMDPLGIALENFNALGMWRDDEKSSRSTPTGEADYGRDISKCSRFEKNPQRAARERFLSLCHRKNADLCLGPGPRSTDEHTLDLIMERLAANDGKFSALIQGVIESAPFQKQRNPAKLATRPIDSSAPTDTRK